MPKIAIQFRKPHTSDMRFNILLVAALIISGALKAQYYDSAPQLVLGFGPAIPTGILGDQQKFGGYGAAQLRLAAGERSDILITAQVSAFRGKTYMVNRKAINSGLLAMGTGLIGYRYFLNPLSDYNSFYIQGDAGLAVRTLKFIKPTVVPSFGYLMNDRLDLNIKYQAILSSPSMSYVTLGIAYGFHFD